MMRLASGRKRDIRATSSASGRSGGGGSGPIEEKPAANVGKIGKIAGSRLTPRYHVLKTAHWEEAKARGYLDPKVYEMGEGIWTAEHPFQWYSEKYGGGNTKIMPDEIELEIRLPKKAWRMPLGGGTADRVTKQRIPLKNITIVGGEAVAPFGAEEVTEIVVRPKGCGSWQRRCRQDDARGH